VEFVLWVLTAVVVIAGIVPIVERHIVLRDVLIMLGLFADPGPARPRP
jgi:hypothetical protein